MKAANFQHDGEYSSSSHLRLRGGMPRSLNDFTMCVRLNLNYLRGDTNHWLSISNDTREDILVGGGYHKYDQKNVGNGSIRGFFNVYLVLEKDPSSAQHLLVTVRRFHPTASDSISVRLASHAIFHTWRHFCFVFASYPLLPSFPLSGRVNLTGKAYLDRNLVAEAHNLISTRPFTQIPRAARVILGQRRTLGGLRFVAEESFSGGISDLRFWREELVEGEIQNLAR